MNLVILYAGFIYVTRKQKTSQFQCQRLSISFADNVWSEALVRTKGGGIEERVLMYSSFSGTYKLETDGAKLETDGARVVGRPVYVEQNKRDGDPFQEKNPARFMYCKEEEAWVFVHDRILQHEDDKEHSKCRWLMKSPKTKSFDLASVPLTGWSVWMGTIVSGETLIITCDECEQNTDCNSNGICEEGECKCKTKEYFGKHCEVEYPCEYMTGEK